MLKNYIIIVLRNIEKNKLYSFINIFGLSLGIICSLLLILYIKFEYSFDKYHSQTNQIYRITSQPIINGEKFNLATSPSPLGPALKRQNPEVREVARLSERDEMAVQIENNFFNESGFFDADQAIFNIFDFSLIRGNQPTCLQRADAVILSESLARKYFNSIDVLGKSIRIGLKGQDYIITGILKDIPENSHFIPAALISFKDSTANSQWVNFSVYTYLLLSENLDKNHLQPTFEEIYHNNIETTLKQFNSTSSFQIQPLTDIHLYSNLQAEIKPGGQLSYIYTFSAVAVFMIIIASINYMNLATARSIKRAKEIGLRKVVGSYKTQLIKQFIIEAVIFTIISMLLSLLVIRYLIGPFGNIFGKEMDISLLGSPTFIFSLMLIAIVVGVLAGSYPAFYLSRLNIVNILNGKSYSGMGGFSFRKFLLILQFILSSIMLISTWVIFDQLQFLSKKDLGFNDKNVIQLKKKNALYPQEFSKIRSAWLNNNNVSFISSGQCIPGGENLMQSGFYLETKDDKFEEHVVLNYNIDAFYIPCLGIRIVKGENFNQSNVNTNEPAIIVNQTLVNMMAWEDPIGKQIIILSDDNEDRIRANVIGVVKDYHLRSLHKTIEPLILTYNNSNDVVLVKIDDNFASIKSNLVSMQNAWYDVNPDIPFEYSFLDENLKKYYIADYRNGKILAGFSLITILIACLGLFGLVAYTAGQRKKEFSIRKINGAGFADIIILVVKDYLMLIGISILLAWPFAYFFISKWLENFAYTISINPAIFIVSALAIILITMLTVSYHATRAAYSNPIEPLHSD